MGRMAGSIRNRLMAGMVAASALLLGGPGFPSPARAAEAGSAVDLDLTFHVHKFPKGALMVAVFDSEAAYASGEKPVAALRLEVKGDTVHTVVPGLKAGRYAIKMFHDLNGSGKLTLNMFGIPTEPVAFSNNAKINMRAPNWTETAFALAPGAGSQSIDID